MGFIIIDCPDFDSKFSIFMHNRFLNLFSVFFFRFLGVNCGVLDYRFYERHIRKVIWLIYEVSACERFRAFFVTYEKVSLFFKRISMKQYSHVRSFEH